MNPEAQRIAIAEACEKLRPDDWEIDEDGNPYVCIDEVWHEFSLSDLNAMHEAEKVLTENQRRDYASALHPRSTFNHMDADFEVAHATAAQRAEAFLRTLGLWKEDK